MDRFMQAAIEEAESGLAEGGIPIGSVLVIAGQSVGRGHNRRVQEQSAILHAEMGCLENADAQWGVQGMVTRNTIPPPPSGVPVYKCTA